MNTATVDPSGTPLSAILLALRSVLDLDEAERGATGQHPAEWVLHWQHALARRIADGASSYDLRRIAEQIREHARIVREQRAAAELVTALEDRVAASDRLVGAMLAPRPTPAGGAA